MDLQEFLKLLLEGNKPGRYDLIPSDEQKRQKIIAGFTTATSKVKGKIKTNNIELAKSIYLSTNSKSGDIIRNNFKNSKLWKEIVRLGLESEYNDYLSGKYFKPILCPECQKEGKIIEFDNRIGLSAHIKNYHEKRSNLNNYNEAVKAGKIKPSNQFTKWGELEIPIYLKQNPGVENITELELRKKVNKGEYAPTYKMPHGSLYQHFGELNPFFGKSHKDSSINKIKGTVHRLIEEGNWHNWIGRKGRSFAEQYFYDIFNKMTDKPINNRYEIGYWMDFAWENGKVYVEVDGEQHYTPEGEAHDKARTEKLAADGWTLVKRVRWSDYKKMSPEKQKEYVKELLEEVEKKARRRFEELGNVELVKTGEETFGLNK